jgi:hypothetical protein
MLGLDLAERGWHMTVTGDPIRRYQVFGERSSGTNFVKRLIGRNTGLKPIESLGWKHGFPQMTAIPEDVAAVCVVRDARDWALSMHAKPWHCPADMQALPFSAFIRAEWATIADRERYFPQVAELGGTGRPLQHDRDPLTGRPYANLFALRRAKLMGLSSFLQRECSVIFARMENVQSDPAAFVDALQAGLGLPPRAAQLRPVVKRLGARFLPATAPRPATPDRMPPEDLAFMRAALDPEQEAALGYAYP